MRRSTPLLVLLAACAADPKARDTGGDTGGAAPVPSWSAPDAWGPYGVGLTTITWTDDRGKELTADVWYPAATSPDDPPANYEPTSIVLDAVRDAPPDLRGGPYPLIAFSHGFAAIRFQSAFLMEHLASHGWVLVAPDHNKNTFFDIDLGATGQVVAERPGDIRASVDHLLAWSDARDDGWAGLIDGSRYVMMGHSFGALTSLVVGGGTVDMSHVGDMCRSGEVRSMACNFISDIDPDLILGTEEADPRAELIVPFSPGVWYGFGREGEGLATTVPSLVLGGTFDDTLTYEGEIRPTWEAMGGPRTLATFEGAGHYVFSDICLIAPFLTEECDGGEDWIDLPAAQQTTEALVTAWLDVEFRGEAQSEPWLTEAGLGAPDYLTLETVSR
jgi:predicted dienelactone hydrolase